MSVYHDQDWIFGVIIVPKSLNEEMDNAFLALDASQLTFGSSFRYLSGLDLPDCFVDLYNAFYRIDSIQLNGLIGDDVSDEDLRAFIGKIEVDDDVEICELIIQYVEIIGDDALQRLEAAICANARLNGIVHIERLDDANADLSL